MPGSIDLVPQKITLYELDNELSFSPSSQIPSIGRICELATKNLNSYSDQYLKKLDEALSSIKSRVDSHRSCNVLNKYYLIFKSSICNYWKGFGFVDSSALLNQTLSQIQNRLNFIADRTVKNRNFIADGNSMVWHRLKKQNPGLNLPNFCTANAIRQWIKTKEAKQIFSQIMELDLSGCNLLALPSEIRQLTSLQWLNIRGNPQLTALPPKIERKERNRELIILR